MSTYCLFAAGAAAEPPFIQQDGTDAPKRPDCALASTTIVHSVASYSPPCSKEMSPQPVDSRGFTDNAGRHRVQPRALDVKELTNAVSTLVETNTEKLNGVTTSGVIKQVVIMSIAVTVGLAVYFLLLRPHLSVRQPSRSRSQYVLATAHH